MMRRSLLPALALWCLLSAVGVASAEQPESDAEARRILVFYNSAEGLSEKQNLFKSGFQMVANYLGYMVDYHDAVQRPLPDAQAMEPYAAVATTFFSGEMPNPDGFNEWFLQQSDAGRRIVILGPLAKASPGNIEENQTIIDDIYGRVGITQGIHFTRVRSLLRYAELDDALVNYERTLPNPPTSYIEFTADPDSTQTIVSVERTDRPAAPGAMVVTGPGGAMAVHEYLYWEDPLTYRRKWYVDPFQFLERAIRAPGNDPLPAFAPAMLNGVRLAFTHIDGDAFMGFTEVKTNGTCAEVMYEEILTRYDLPFTVSVIVAEIDPDLGGSQEYMEQARRIFALPNVEPASHTYSHPYVWDPDAPVMDDFYGRHGYNLPGYEFEADTEIVYSAEWIQEHLTPAGKPCRILLWSGDCSPTPEQLALAREAGLLQMNGGDTVYDSEHDTLFNVAPPYRYAGGEYQVYTGQANENILTNLWHGPYFAYREILETMKRTGAPRLLAPVNPYYHFYSAEKAVAVEALHTIYRWVQEQDLAHVYASDWIRSVQGFITAEIDRPEPGRYVFRDFGQCRTVRFATNAPSPDLARSRGVIGHRRTGEGLFVFIDPDVHEAEVVLDSNAPDLPHIERASGNIIGFTRKNGSVSFSYSGHAPGFVDLAGLEPGRGYDISIRGENNGVRHSNAEGGLNLSELPTGPVEIHAQ